MAKFVLSTGSSVIFVWVLDIFYALFQLFGGPSVGHAAFSGPCEHLIAHHCTGTDPSIPASEGVPIN